MTSPADLLAECEALGIRLSPASNGDLTVRGPKHALTGDLIERLKGLKVELLTLLAPPTDRRPLGKAICRCGSPAWRDVPIHGGRSLRRDCGRCGRFISFPVWHGQDTLRKE
jgi:hypothetical protein